MTEKQAGSTRSSCPVQTAHNITATSSAHHQLQQVGKHILSSQKSYLWVRFRTSHSSGWLTESKERRRNVALAAVSTSLTLKFHIVCARLVILPRARRRRSVTVMTGHASAQRWLNTWTQATSSTPVWLHQQPTTWAEALAVSVCVCAGKVKRCQACTFLSTVQEGAEIWLCSNLQCVSSDWNHYRKVTESLSVCFVTLPVYR